MSDQTTPAAETVVEPQVVQKSYLVIRIPVPSKKTLVVAGASIVATVTVVATVLHLKNSDSDNEDGYMTIETDYASSETSSD